METKELGIVGKWEKANGYGPGRVESELKVLRWHHDLIRCYNYVGLAVLALVIVVGMALWYSDHQIAAAIVGLVSCAGGMAFLVYNRPSDLRLLGCEVLERFLRDFTKLSKVVGLSMDFIDSMPVSVVSVLAITIMETGMPKNRLDNSNLFHSFGLIPRRC